MLEYNIKMKVFLASRHLFRFCPNKKIMGHGMQQVYGSIFIVRLVGLVVTPPTAVFRSGKLPWRVKVKGV